MSICFENGFLSIYEQVYKLEIFDNSISQKYQNSIMNHWIEVRKKLKIAIFSEEKEFPQRYAAVFSIALKLEITI